MYGYDPNNPYPGINNQLFNNFLQNYTKPMRDNNPGMAEAVAYVNKSGLSPKQAFMKLAKERGLDPNEVMRQFKALR